MADYYQLLGVSRDANSDDIKKAYRKLALKYHPDRNQGGSKETEDRFKEATEAYEVLRDSERRTVYDRYGEQGLKRNSGGSEGFDFTDAVEIFMRDFGGFGGIEDLFGGRQRSSSGAARKGQAIKVRVPLTLLEVSTGVTKTLKVAVLGSCEGCDGSGAAEGSGPVACTTCGGSGEQRHVQRSVFGQFVSVAPCRTCGGEGRVIDDPCDKCNGDGRTRTHREIEVEIPAGVTSENFLTLRGEGNQGPRGGPSGDIIVLLEVEDDTPFVRDGPHLRYELPVTFSQAALGAEVEVPTVDGSVRLTVPPGVQSGEVLRLRGRGLPELNGRTKGDQLVRIVVWTPDRLSVEQEEVLQALRDVEDAAPEHIEGESRRSLWSRVKETFSQA
jgi:molecular chaperone DnaJ